MMMMVIKRKRTWMAIATAALTGGECMKCKKIND